jgi:hypothetical protein
MFLRLRMRWSPRGILDKYQDVRVSEERLQFGKLMRL